MSTKAYKQPSNMRVDIDKKGREGYDIYNSGYAVYKYAGAIFMTKREFQKAGIIAAAIFAAGAIAYLILSLVQNNWGVSWLTILGGAVAAGMVFIIFLITDGVKNKKQVLPRALVSAAVAAVFLFVYACVTVLSEVEGSWMLLLIMLIAVSGTDAVYAFWTTAKGRMVSAMVFIQVSTALEYVILAKTGLISWHPFWLIPAIGFVINAAIATACLYEKARRKRDTQEE